MTTQIEVGDIEVRRVVEQEGPFFDPLKFFPDLTQERLDENRAWLEPQALDPATGQIVLCVQSYVLRTPERTILVDTCVGNHKERVTRPFWHMRTDESYMRALAEAGLTVDDIDLVLCTHLHPDHVGWNTRLAGGRWVPTFPNARYLFSEREFTHWRERHAEAPIAYMADSVLPIVEAGRADFVRSDRRIDERVRLEPTPGHTIDHFAVRFGSAGEEGVVTGDLIHSPLQCRYPELSVFVDYDKVQSARTRRSLLEGCAADGTLVCTAHFPSPSMGRIARREDGFRFEPV